MQHAPPSRVKRPKSYARPMTPSSKPGIQGSFKKAHHFTIQNPTFCDGSHYSRGFMKEFAKQTIPGAAFDSSERDPPPRCHPETRLTIVERTLGFFAGVGESNKRLLWLVGPAGVGKSAIMQTLAETSSTPDFTLGASLFFSVNGRDNGSKTMVTLAYQLAVKSKLYKRFIENEFVDDPTLLDKALAAQFRKFIFEPFVVQGISPERHERFLILIDGLDECNSTDTQRTILDLISSFCIKYPAAPLVWVIASRPEPHITRFLSQLDVTASYTKEEIEVDDDESRKDVERYLRDELEKIRTKYPALDHFSRWPAEYNFLKLATAAGGLFAFGQTVVDYIDDPVYANPALQLEEVLDVIDEIRSQVPGEGKRHPMAGLDVLYSRIISKIPPGTLNDTRMLLLYTISPLKYEYDDDRYYFDICCNWLGISIAAAYGALHHLHSVLNIPSVPDAPSKALEFRHKSFRDYLTDFERSGMFQNADDDANELHTQRATRILEGVSKGRKNVPCDGILLSWPPPIEDREEEYKRHQYYCVLRFVTQYLRHRCLPYGPGVLSALKLIDVQYSLHFGYWEKYTRLASVIFGNQARPALKKLNAFQEMSFGLLKMDQIPDWLGIIVTCRSQRHDGPVIVPPRCSFGYSHKFNDSTSWVDEPRPSDRGSDSGCQWTEEYPLETGCDCKPHALRKMEARKTYSPGDIVTTFTDVTGNYGWVHHTFPDSKYPSTTWEYIFPYEFKPAVAVVEPV